jgi:hypothetical protein
LRRFRERCGLSRAEKSRKFSGPAPKTSTDIEFPQQKPGRPCSLAREDFISRMGKGNMVIKRPKTKISASASLSPSALSRRLDKRDRKGNAQIQKIVACPYQISRSTFPEHALMRRD